MNGFRVIFGTSKPVIKEFMKSVLSFFACFLLFICFSSRAHAQDTVQVQTLTFDDITRRSGTWTFPSSDNSWEKVLMHYTLKCDPRTTRDGFNCGEWDYLTYTMVTDSTGVIDSTMETHPNFLIAYSSPVSFSLQQTLPIYKQQYHQIERVVDTLRSENSAVIGSNTNSGNEALISNRVQYLYTAQELNNAGMFPGEITGLAFDVLTSGISVENLKIKVIPVAGYNANHFTSAKAYTAFYGNFNPSLASRNKIQMLEPFTWNGTDDIVVEFSQISQLSSTFGDLAMDQTLMASSYKSGAQNTYLEILNNGHLEVSDASTVMSSIDSQITVMFWTKGDDLLPVNTSLFEAKNSANQRVLNAHLPWGNGSIYWDAGNRGTSYDRINKAASASNYKGQWNHWAFVKNAQTGSMKIYLNGSLWHSGTGFTRSMKGITSFNFGRGIQNYQYRGKLDDIQVWKKEIDQATIQAWMNKALDNTHPNYADLVFSFDFEPTHSVSNYEFKSMNDNSIRSFALGQYKLEALEGEDYFRLGQPGIERPRIEFYMADQVTHFDTAMVTRNEKSPSWTVSLYNDATNPTKRTGFDNGYGANYIYDLSPSGAIIDSTFYPASSTYTKKLNPYYRSFEVINNIEIGRYITPYGIGLDLGPEGFRWVYDVTDYAKILADRVTLSAGNQQELIDLRFEFIKGTPPREVKKIHHIANRVSRQYKSIADDTYFKNDTFNLLSDAKTFKLITRITGHGHNGESGNGKIHCCEWADKNHNLKINRDQGLTKEWDIWQNDKCALNPVADQGGNWAPPRAGWCPAAPVDDYNFELTEYVKDGTLEIDYGVEAVPENNLGQGNGNYVVTLQLVEYGDISFDLDAAIKDIISPNSWEFYRRINPTCATPKIVLQNKGKEPLVGASLVYGVEGGNPIQFYWEGNLGFMEEETIDLPFAIWDYVTPNSDAKFYAEVSLANGKVDEYAKNNRVAVDFNIPEVMPYALEVMYRNNNIQDADLVITNDRNEVVYEKKDAPAGVLSRDQITLDAGCYKMEIETENGFGLAYPLIPEVGTGFIRLREVGGVISKAFNLDFGKRLTYYFTVGYGVDTEDSDKLRNATSGWSVYPNPSSGKFIFTTQGSIGQTKIKVLNLQGQVLLNTNVESNNTFEIDLSSYSSGMFLLQIEQNGKTSTERLIKH